MRARYMLLAATLIGCGQYRQLTQQLPTFANMQTVARNIQSVVERDGSISDEAALAIVMKMNNGLDDWGNRLLYIARSGPDFSFVLVSSGRDGLFEKEDPSGYFEVQIENIVGDLDRDIVFRDGKPMTDASGK